MFRIQTTQSIKTFFLNRIPFCVEFSHPNMILHRFQVDGMYRFWVINNCLNADGRPEFQAISIKTKSGQTE